uniref:Mitochondrial inner membrane protease subunit n=1 Tax=Nitzschia sp. IriIs04 TaxID=1444690 RepID=A0A0P0YUY1_9STRA|nr:thylakoid processing peptidase [Nitzschia sp. IriIs04]
MKNGRVIVVFWALTALETSCFQIPLPVFSYLSHIPTDHKPQSAVPTLRPNNSRVSPLFHSLNSNLFGSLDDYQENHNELSEDSEDNDFPSWWRYLPKWMQRPETEHWIRIIKWLGVALLLRLFVMEPRTVVSSSMYPTNQVGDYLLVDKVSPRLLPLARQDCVVFRAPEAFYTKGASQEEKIALLKRVVAIEGDTVEMKDGTLFINGLAQHEPYIAESARYSFDPLEVPPGFVLVLGDNRNHSYDSHVWGFLPTELVFGKVFARAWPLQRMGRSGH